MTTKLTEVMKSFIISKLRDEVQKKQLQHTEAEIEKEIITLADKLVKDMLPQLQQTEKWIIETASEFANHISKFDKKDKEKELGKSVIPHQPATNKEQDIIDWINEVARDAANNLKAEYQQGDIHEKDLAGLLGKIEAYRASTLEALHTQGLSDERKEKLVKKLLNKYQVSVDETVQQLHEHTDSLNKQTEESVNRKKLFGIF